MRVYELAREAGVSSADVLSAAEKCGADVSSAISTIDEGDVAALKLAVSQLDRRDAEAKPYFKHAMIYGGRESATVLEHYSEVLRALGENDLADYYKRLSEQKEK